MKSLKYLFFITVVFLLSGYFLLFTANGNRMLLPVANSYIAKNLPSHLHAKLQSFRATPSAIDAKVTINDTVHLDFHGPVSWLQKTFDLQYRLYGKGVRIGRRVLPGRIDVTGKARGSVQRFQVDGNGTELNARLLYRFDMDKMQMRNIDADVKEGDLESMLLLSGLLPLAKGRFDLHLHTPDLDDIYSEGKADFTVREGRANRALIFKMYGIDLPDNFTFAGEGHVKLRKMQALGWVALKSTLGNLLLKEGRYDIARKSFDAQYYLVLPKLEALQPVLKRSIRGKAEVEGHLYLSDTLRLEGVTKSLEGEIAGAYEKGKAVVVFKDVALRKLLYTLAYPQVADGRIFTRMQYSFALQKGDVNGTIRHARFLENQLTKAVAAFEGIDLRKEQFDKALFHAKIDPWHLFFTLDAAAPKSHIRIYDAQIKTTLNFIDAKFDIDFHGKTFRGRLKGDLSAPQVELDTADYIKSRVGKTVDKYIDKEDQQKIKNVVKKELKNFGMEDLNATKIMKGMMDIFF